MKLKGVWGASLVLAALAASACDQEQPLPELTPASVSTAHQEVKSTNKVLILGSSVNGGINSVEAQAVKAIKPTWAIDIVTPAQWKAMTATQFMGYRAIIIGDASCQTGTAAFQAAVDNRTTWGAVVDGYVTIIGADSASNQTPQVVDNALRFTLNTAQYRTGIYISLGCAYKDAPAGTSVPLLDQFGGEFKVQGLSFCANAGHMFQMYPPDISQNISGDDTVLTGNTTHCAARSVFTSYPDRSFAFAAIAMNNGPQPVPAQRQFIDYSWNEGVETPFVGTPFILVRGAMAIGAGCGRPEMSSGEECDLLETANGNPSTNGAPPETTCSFSCHNNWCGDGHVDTEFGEQCDNGELNGRALGGAYDIGPCTSFCLNTNIPNPNHPPVALCKDVTVVATNTCGVAASVDNGSYDEDGDLNALTDCVPDIAGPYPIGNTLVKLTCTDAKGNSATCATAGKVTVTDKVLPTVTLVGSASQSVECGSSYTDPGYTANDLCDGPLAQSAVTKTGTVLIGTPNTYNLTYQATDKVGNKSTVVTRAVTVADTLAPTIAVSPTTITQECAVVYTDTGVTANDACEGNVTAKIVKTGSVNVAVVADYQLRYDVSDAAGHPATQAVRNVFVRDRLKPTVTVVGSNVVAECNGTLTDPGATASDTCNGTLPTSINASSVNLSVPGNYAISYKATDLSGNVGVSGNRGVTVSDTLVPVLTLNGLANMPLECAAVFTDPGAVANDQCYGNISSSILRTGTVDNKVLGPYTLTYNVKDAKNNAAAAITRKVTVSDTKGPVITVNGPLSQNVECGNAYADPGASANDACVGPITAVATPPANPNAPGNYNVFYTATDPSGNTTKSSSPRAVTVSDTQPPTLTLLGSATSILECGTPYNDPGYSASDLCAGPLTANVTKTGTVNHQVPGPYSLHYTVSDGSSHSVSADRSVTVKDTLAPTVTMTGASTVALECGAAYSDLGATANDACAGSLPAVATSSPNPSVPNTYTISYKATDPSGNTGFSSGSRSVVVSDTLPPTLTLNGNALENLECGTPYVDPKATANDQCAGSLPVTVAGGVNEKIPANYTLTYSANDGQGHPVSANRTVKVADTLSPTIAVMGALDQTYECGSSYTDPGATANDACDGSLTAAIKATSSGNTSTPNTFTITYSVKDNAGHETVSPTQRTVHVNDNAPPTLTLLGTGTVNLECADPFTDPGAKANDVCFGDVTSRIVRTGTVNNMAPGNYGLTYNVSDPAGQAAPAVSRTVNVKDSKNPVVTVTGPLTVNLECGNTPYSDPGATANDACAGVLAAIPSTTVNPKAPGPYAISYTATDPSGNTGVSATSRTVTVSDTLAPVLALNGAATMGLECATPFTDPGATANDACAGTLPVTVTGSVNNKTLGAQSLHYAATDGAHPVSADRTVTVSDTVGPAITVKGPLNDTFECGSTYVDPGATGADACAGPVAVTSKQTGDPSHPGNITYEYSAVDPSGNKTTSPTTRTVTVNDNAPPVLVLIGSGSQSQECGSPYTDPGATANDACFGDQTARIVKGGSVNVNVPAAYQLTYDVTDQSGQSAPTARRTVNVADTLAPSLTVLGQLNQTVQCGSGPYADPGATATDACAGNLTSAIQKLGSVDPTSAGNYTISYSVSDPAGHTVTSSDVRKVTVADDIAPTIALKGPATLGLECGTPYNEQGATANDACAGDLTAQISKSGTVNHMQPALYTVHYSVTDPSNHTAAVDRQVTVSDTLPPVLALNGPATQGIECGSAYVDPGATATDVCAGNLDAAVTKSGSVNAAAVGNYNVAYTVSDSAGHTVGPVNRAVAVSDTLKPVITVNGAADETFECGSTYADPGATASDQCAGNLTAAINAVRSPLPDGGFTITYSVADPSGNSVTSPIVRKVHVNDDAAPVLALKGPALLNQECATPFVDPGATANDACTGDVSAAITRSGSVNSNTLADYTLVYNVADSSGNTAQSVSRTVHVQDTQLPSITVLGPTVATYECGGSYTDPGATATDACAGNLTAAIVATRTPVPNQPANFTITYSVKDPSNNQAVSSVKRTVTKNDSAPPSIALVGPATQVLECSRTPYADPGATATDLCEGNVPVTASGTVNTQAAGNYVRSYVATDGAGNSSPTVTRQVRITDTLGPAITLNGSNVVKLECKVDTYTDLGATADDICSGPAPVTADTSAVNPNATGAYLVRYSATDASNNTNTAVRNVLVEDHLPPTIALNAPNPTQLECGTPYTDPGATASDTCQGDVSSSVFIEFNGVDKAHEGNYVVKYQAQDNFGNLAHATRDVKVKDNLPPVLTVTGLPTMELECGVQPDLGVKASDACYGDLTGAIVRSPAVLPRAPGDYTVTYSVTDPAGHPAAGTVSRQFTVVDTGEPVLSVNGPSDIFYECTGHAIGNVWQNPGASATDSCQGDLVVHQYNTGDDDGDGIPGDIDADDFGPGPTTEVEGLYYVQYLAWDDSYNIQGAILSVYVQDTLKPVLFLNGSENVQTQCFLPTDDPTDPDQDVEVDPDPYVELGATGDDQCYGDVSPSVLTFGDVNKQSPGVYTIEYDVRDGAFNWADPVTRSVEVIDNLSPKLKLNAPIKQSPADNTMRTVELSECAVAWDLCDGYMDIMVRAEELAVTSNDPANDASDIQVLGNKFKVRAKNSANGGVRIYTATYKVTDGSFNGTNGACQVFVPGSPVVSAPVNGSTLTLNKPTFSGVAEPRSTVTVKVDGVVVGTATASTSGAWSFTATVALSNGSHAVKTSSKDAAGNVSAESAAITFTVAAPFNGSTLSDNAPATSGATPSGTVTMRFQGR